MADERDGQSDGWQKERTAGTACLVFDTVPVLYCTAE